MNRTPGYGLTAIAAALLCSGALAVAAPASANAASPASQDSMSTGSGYVTYTLPAASASAPAPTAKAAPSAATPLVAPAIPSAAAAAATSADQTPNPIHFGGVPPIGTLFSSPVYAGGQLTDAQHFCTASVINSPHGDLVMTAAHCVDGSSGPAKFLQFAPAYDNGPSRYGVWTVSKISVTAGWAKSQDPTQDFAFLQIAPAHGRTIQQYTGALQLAKTRTPALVTVVGYNDVQYDAQGNQPIVCLTKAFAVTEDNEPYSRFNCNNYQDGTSGGPWVIAGTNLVIGDIGGYETGGDYPNYSFSAVYSQDIFALFHAAGG